MNTQENPTLTRIQKFLSAVHAHFVPNLRSAQEFLNVFSPELVMDRMEDAELRAQILISLTGTHPKIAQKISKRSAGEHLKIALEEGVTTPKAVLESFAVDHRVQYLNNQDLWIFVSDSQFWESKEHIPESRNEMAVMIGSGLELGLIDPEELVKAIGFQNFFAKGSNQDLIATIEALANPGTENPYSILLARYPSKEIAANVDLSIVWERVIHPLIAVRHGLVSDDGAIATQSKTEFEEIVPEDTVTTDEQKKEDENKKPDVASPQPSTPPSPVRVTPAFSGSGGVLPGSRVSSVPAASRLHSGGGYKDPKGLEASDGETSDVDGEGDVVGDGELISDEGIKAVSVVETQKSPESERRALFSSMPPVLRPPRPGDSRAHAAGSPDMEINVGYASSSDPEVVAALEAEQQAMQQNEAETSYISDDEFRRAGGSDASDVPASSEESSLTSANEKTAICMLLRSKEVRIRLSEIDIFDCEMREVLTAALEELEMDADKSYVDLSKRELASLLCDEMKKRHPEIEPQLRLLLVKADCIAPESEPVKTPSRSGPPPLPSAKSLFPPLKRRDR